MYLRFLVPGFKVSSPRIKGFESPDSRFLVPGYKVSNPPIQGF